MAQLVKSYPAEPHKNRIVLSGDLENYINSTGKIGSSERLQTISNLDLGKRSESAKRVLDKRNYRKDLMDEGHSFEDAVLIVNRNYES